MKAQAQQYGVQKEIEAAREKLVEKIIISDKQFGKKVKHATDYGLDMHTANDREKFRKIILDICKNSDYIVKNGVWRGQNAPVNFYIKGEDVVVVNSKNEFITILKGGINNERVKKAWNKNQRKS